ncbi:carbohydrate ABC transporter membrane protein 1, CUT1 family [Ruaniaceae bacterium KH17]|nr:carbohydrate ABC transporter membrane protein 1, CUT1 family [Ruaniaceae bacterium KH17]
MLALFLLPVVWALYSSMTNQTLSGANASNPSFIGLQNYVHLFTDERTWAAMWRTLLFVGFSVIGQNLGGFLLAYSKQSAARVVQKLVNTIVVTAWIIPEVVVGFLWYTLLRGDTSSLNQVLDFLGLPTQDFLTTAPLFAVIIMNIWRGMAFSMLIYSAAIQDVPEEMLEAAQLDGANRYRRIIHVIIPTINPVIATTVVLTTLNTLGVFGLIWVTTRGGPGMRSETLSILMYNEAYGTGLIGYGSAIAVILLGIGVVFALLYIRIARRGSTK